MVLEDVNGCSGSLWRGLVAATYSGFGANSLR